MYKRFFLEFLWPFDSLRYGVAMVYVFHEKISSWWFATSLFTKKKHRCGQDDFVSEKPLLLMRRINSSEFLLNLTLEEGISLWWDDGSLRRLVQSECSQSAHLPMHFTMLYLFFVTKFVANNQVENYGENSFFRARWVFVFIIRKLSISYKKSRCKPLLIKLKHLEICDNVWLR